MAAKELTICHRIGILASAECVWKHITDVDIAAFSHPAYLAALGIPKPLRSEIVEAGVGGVRIAYFDNNRRFMQEITTWEPPKEYSFTFRADPGFRVGYLLDLSNGPFRMKAGRYDVSPAEDGVNLVLTSWYELRGVSGMCLSLPVWVTLGLFQNYLLRGIKANSEREHAEGNCHH